MPSSLDLSRLACDLASSGRVPDRAVVGVTQGERLEFAISPPLDDLLGELIGFDAPPQWAAAAVVADVRGDDRSERRTWITARSGEEATAIAGSHQLAEPLGPFAGVIVADALRRCLGLGTEPPASPYALLDEIVWLDRLVAGAAVGPLDIAAALALHESTLGSRPVGGRWRALHRSATQQASRECRHRFAWMDTGMFSRWVLGLWPAPGELIDTLADLVEPAVVATVLARCPHVRARLVPLGSVSA